MRLSNKWKLLNLFVFFQAFSSFGFLFSQVSNTNTANICDGDNNNYTFASGTARVGTWVVAQGYGEFSNPTSHSFCDIKNIANGVNIFQFWDPSYSAVVPEHILTITNTKTYAGRDTILCSPNNSYQLNASNPAALPGSNGTWSLIAGTGTITTPNSYNTTVTNLGIGTNRFRWLAKNLPGCGNSFDDVSITVANPPNAFAGNDKTICTGGSATLTATAGVGYTYLWSTGQTSQSITVNPLVTTNYMLTVTDGNKCKATDDADVYINTLNIFNVSSSATTYCMGSTGATISLSGSEVGVNYQLKKGGVNDGAAVAGNGAIISWSNKTAGTYTVVATNPVTTCSDAMNGSVTITANPLPVIYNFTASSPTYCSHISGVTLNLSNSENGANFQYQLYKNGVALGFPLGGTGNPLTWTNITSGNYSVLTTNTLTSCSSNMAGTPSVTSIVSPSVYKVEGSGLFCETTSGLNVKLDNSEIGINYQLLKDGFNSGAPKAGTGGVLTWNGNLEGVFTVQATNGGGTCTRTMNSNAVIIKEILPVIFDVSSDASGYCSGGSGVSVSLSGSQIGVNYQLIKDGVPTGGAVIGDGNPLLWVNNLKGVYKIEATKASVTCAIEMNGTINVSEYPLPVQYAIPANLTYCSNIAGATIELSSSQNGANYKYQLFKSGLIEGAPLSGTGAPIQWTGKTFGTYTVIATNTVNGCSQNMSGTSTVAALQAPDVFNVSGTGNYCQGTTGLSISLSGSEATDVNYQLLKNGISVGASKPGTGLPISWNNQLNGAYTVNAINVLNNCVTPMNASAVLTEIPLPAVYTLSGASKYCFGTNGITLTLSGSQIGIIYTLKDGLTTVGTKTGTGAPLSWVNVTAGNYTVEAATNGPIVCSVVMNGSVNVSTLALPVINAGADQTICFGQSVQLSASGGNSFSWSPALSLSDPGIFNPFASPSSTTNYTVTATDINGCTSSDQVQIVVRALPNAVASTSQTICNGEIAILTATDNIIGNNEAYLWSTGSTNDTIKVSPSTTTNYFVTITDAFGCKNNASTSVNVNSKPGVNAGSDTKVCQGGTVKLNGSGDANTWEWSTGATTLSVNVSPSFTTDYILKGTYTATGCYSLDTVKVTVNTPPAVTFTLNGLNNTQFCSNGALVNLAGVPAGGVFSSSVAGAISGNKFDPIIAGLGTHTITYTYSDVNGCTGTKNISVDVLPPSVVSITGLSASYCNTGMPFTVTGNPLQDGNGVFGTWLFSGPALAFTNNGNGTCTIDPAQITADGNYNLTYNFVNSSGCVSTTTKSFAVKLSPPVNFVGLPATACQNSGSIIISGNQGTGGTFSGQGITDNTNGTASYNPVSLLPGNYSILFTYTDPVSLCSASVSKTITVNATPSLFSVTGGGSYCAGGAGVQIGLTGSSVGVSYELFLNGTSTGATIAGSGLAVSFGNQTSAGTYTVTATNAVTLCTVSMNGSAVVNINPFPLDAQVITGMVAVCPGSTQKYTVPAIQNATTYIWQLPANATITSGLGTASVDITFAANAASGNITVYGQNACGLGGTSLLPVTVKLLPAAAGVITGAQNICQNSVNTVYTVPSILNATSYLWTVPSGATIMSGQGTETIVVDYGSGALSGNVSVKGVNTCGNGTASALPITVTPTPQLTKNAPSGQITCNGNIVNVSATSSTANVTYFWTAINGGNITSAANTSSITVNSAGKYIITVTAPVNSCINRDTVTVISDIQAPQNVNITFTNLGQVTCLVPDLTLTASTTSIFPVGYQWTASSGGNITSGINTANPTVNKGGVYEVKVTNLNTGCFTVKSVTVSEIKTAPDITVTTPDDERISCSKNSVTLSGSSTTSGVGYLWSGPGVVSGGTGVSPVVNATGIYTLTVTASNGCTSSATVQVLGDNSVAAINVDNNPPAISCKVSTVTLNGSSTTVGATLLWNGPGIVSGQNTETPVINKAGVYTLTVTHPLSGCPISATVTVSQNTTAPSVIFPVIPSTITCALPNVTVNSSSSAVNKTFLWSTLNGFIVSGATNQDVVVSKAGTYTLKITDSDNGCSASSSVDVTENKTLPDAQIGLPGSITCAQPTIQLSGTTATIPRSIEWTTTDGNIISGVNNLNPTISKGGTYVMKVTNTTTQCFNEASVLVSENTAKPVISIEKTPPVITCASPLILLNGTAAGSNLLWTGPAGAIISNAASSTPLVDKAGKYYLTATNAFGCSSKDSTVVASNIVKPLGLSIDAPAIMTCASNIINLTGKSTTPLATFKWSALGGQTIISAANADIITINSPGDYKMVVTDPSSFCKDSLNVTVSQDVSAPVISFPTTPVAITCSQITSALNANVTPVGSALLWTGPGTISDNTVSNPTVNAEGTYTLKAIHPVTGCITVSTLLVPVDKVQPDISFVAPDAVTCLKPNSLIDVTTTLTNFTAKWTTTNGSIVGADNTIDVIAGKDGLYNLRLKNNDNGCISTQNILVAADNSSPDIMVNPNPAKLSCKIFKVELFGTSATAGASLLWSGPGGISGSGTQKPLVDAIGTYTLTVTGTNGCKSAANVIVTDDQTTPPVPVIIPPAKITCSTPNILLELSPVPVNTDILWTTAGTGKITNETTSKPTIDDIGTYTVQVTDRTSGCSSQNTVVVAEDKNVSDATIIGGPYEITCTNASLQLEGTTVSGINPVWTASSGGHIVSNANSLKPTIDAAGTYTFTITNPATGCINSSNVVVTKSASLPALFIDPFPQDITCSRTQVTLSGQPNEPGTTYTWTASPGNITSGGNSFNPIVDKAGTYILEVTKTATGCISKAAIEVKEDKTAPLAVIAVPEQFTCSRSKVQLLGSTATPGASAQWTTTGTGSITPGEQNLWNPTVLTPATYTLTVTNLTNQCYTKQNIVVTEDKTNPNISVNKTPLPLTCKTKQVIISGSSSTAGTTYLWTTSGSGNITNPSSSNTAVDAIGIYTLKVTNPANGCSSTDIVTVTDDLTAPQIWVNTTPSVLNCNRDTVYIKGSSTTNNVSYLWSGPGIISNATIREPFVKDPGVYTLTITAASNGCTSSLPVTVTRNTTIPAAPLLTGNTACFGSPATALTAVGNSIQWYSNPALGSAYKIQSGISYSPLTITLPNDYSFYATQTDAVSQCESPAAQVIYTIRSLPATPVNTNKTICEGDPDKTLTASGTNINWYSTPGGAWISSGTYTPAVSAPGTYTYYTTQTDGNGCESQAKDIALIIRPKPAKPLVSQLSASVCNGNTNPVFTASGTNLNWYTSPTLPAPVKSEGSFTPLETSSGIYSYFVTQTSAYGCVSPYETVTLNILPVPQAFIVTGGGVYCENTNGLAIGLSGSQLNTSYQLILNNTTVVTSMNGTGAALNFGLQKGTGNYTVKATDNNLCSSMMNGGVSIAVNSLPGKALNITGQPSVCEGAVNLAYSVTSIPNATSYTWNVPAGAIITSGLNTRAITIDFALGAVTGQVTVFASNSCGTGAISPNLQVIVNPLPVASGNIKYIAVNNVVCLGDSGKIYEVDPITNATSYEWILPAGTTVYAGANSRQIRVKFASNAATGNQVVKVRGVNSCGMGAFSANYQITVNPNPAVYAGIDQNLCSTQTTLLGSAVPGGGTGLWNQVQGYSVIINSGLANSQVTDITQGVNVFTWKVTYNGCSAADTVKIFNNKLNVDAGEDLPICSQNITLKGTIPPAGTNGIWTVRNGAASFIMASQAGTTASSFGYGDNKLYWTVTKNGCESRDSVIITSYRPVFPDAGADQIICTNNTMLNATAPLYGSGKWSVYSGQASIANINDPKTAVTSLGKGKNVLLWTVTNMICSLTDTVNITNNEIDVNAGYDQTLCENRTTLEATTAPSGSSGQWSVLLGSASFLDNKINNTKVSGLVNGPNKLIWSITRGSCVNTDTITLTCNMPSSANAGPDQFLANGNAILDANQPVVGIGKWNVISGAANFVNQNLFNTAVTGLNPGVNVLRWNITFNGCSTYDEVSVTNGTIEKVDAGQDQVICTNQTVLEAARPQYGFGIWTVQKGSANFEDNEAYNTKATNLAAGTNILRWSVVVSGIEFYDTVVIVNNQPTAAITGPKQILCIDSSALAGNVPIQGTGKWTLEGGSAVIKDILQNNSKVTALGNGDNIFRWTITKGTCVSSTLLVITNDKPTPSYAGLDQTICDDKTSLIPNPVYIGTGEWSVVSGSGRFVNNEVTGLARGQNILRWTIRKNNCSSFDDMVVISHKPTAASAGLNSVVCVDSMVLSANKANNAIGEFGRWSIMNGSGQIADTTLNTSLIRRLAQGVNVLRWTINNNGCISYSDVQVNYAYVNSSAGVDLATCDNHIILNANNPTLGTGEWSVVGGSGSAVFTDSHSPNTEVKNLDQGKNILKWTISNFSCLSSSEVIITNNAPSVAFAGGDQSLCINNSTLAGRQSFVGKGNWSVLSGSGLFADSSVFNTKVYNIGSGANTYRWTVRNQNCMSIDEVVIANNKPIGTYAGLDQTLCVDSAILSANQPIVGTGVWSIIKGAGQIQNALSAASSIQKLASDTNIVRWTVSNKQCVEYQEIKLVNNVPTMPSAGADRVLCSDQASMDGNSPLNGSGEWQVISGSGTFASKNLYNSEIRGLTLGKNIFRWKISKQGCVLSDDVILTNDLPSRPDAGTDIAVCDNNSPLNANKPSIGYGYWSIVSGKGVFIDTAQYNTRVVGLGQGSNLLTWTTVHNRCVLVDVVEVRNNQTNVYAGPDQTVYENNSILVGNEPLRGVGTWLLNGGGGNISSPNAFESTVTGLEEGINTFLWSVDISGCISSDAVQITYYKLPTASFSINQTDGCPPLEVRFTKTSIEKYPYHWEFGTKDSVTTTENPVFTYDAPGKYSAKLVVTGPDGKPVEMIKTITVHDLPVANFELVPAKVYIPDEELRCFNYSTGGKTFLWNFGDNETSTDLNPSHNYQDSGLYTVKLKVISDFGCVDSLTLINGIQVIESSKVKFPSAFSPNMNGANGGAYNKNDYSNDVFFPIVINGEINNYRLEVYNRWGVLIFESKDVNVGWDGYYKEKLMMEDVYIYRLTGRLNNGKKISATGDFLLMHKDH